MIALLQLAGADLAFRLHHKRHYDFRRGERLGHDHHIVAWQRPQRPDWMSEAIYATMPETIRIREVRFHIDSPGSRSRELIVATTLLDYRKNITSIARYSRPSPLIESAIDPVDESRAD